MYYFITINQYLLMISILIITCLSLVCIILQYKLYTLTKIREHQDETIKLLEDNSTSQAVMVEVFNINQKRSCC